jgi:metal-responsive CopG/Arc/MetJ family transcriptional regulator
VPEYDFSKGRRGPIIPVHRGKTRITIRLDKDLIDWFRSQVGAAGGGNYQTLINSALRNYVREVTSEIAEGRARYGNELRDPRVRSDDGGRAARSERAARKPVRPRRGKGARVISVGVEHDLLSRVDALAKDLGLSRAGLFERSLRAMLAAHARV